MIPFRSVDVADSREPQVSRRETMMVIGKGD